MPGDAAEATVIRDLLIGLRMEGFGAERCLKKVPTENVWNRGKLWALQLSIFGAPIWREQGGSVCIPAGFEN